MIEKAENHTCVGRILKWVKINFSQGQFIWAGTLLMELISHLFNIIVNFNILNVQAVLNATKSFLHFRLKSYHKNHAVMAWNHIRKTEQYQKIYCAHFFFGVIVNFSLVSSDIAQLLNPSINFWQITAIKLLTRMQGQQNRPRVK